MGVFVRRDVAVRFMDRVPPAESRWDPHVPSGTAFVVGGVLYVNEADAGSDGRVTPQEERDLRNEVRIAFWEWMGKAKPEATRVIAGPGNV